MTQTELDAFVQQLEATNALARQSIGGVAPADLAIYATVMKELDDMKAVLADIQARVKRLTR